MVTDGHINGLAAGFEYMRNVFKSSVRRYRGVAFLWMDGRHTAGGQIAYALHSQRLGGFMFDLSLALGFAAMGWLVGHNDVCSGTR